VVLLKENEMPKVIAVEVGANLDPAEAIFVFEECPDRPMRWWHSEAWEDLDLDVGLFEREYDCYRPCELQLPKDWEAGRIVVVNGDARFKYYP
jgi:hypothetical protein